MMSDLKVALTLTADGKQLIGTVNNTQKVVSDLNTKLNQTKGASNNAAQGLTVVDRQSSSAAKSIQHMGRMAVGAFAGISAINLGQKITQDLAAFQDVRTRLQSLSGSTAAYAANEKYLMQLTREHHKELIPLADNYAALLNLQDAGLVTQSQARALLEGMSNAQSSLGASTEQLKQSLYGLSQGLASPIVRAEELNQIVEPMPGLLNKMDKAAQLPSGGFRQMVLDGKVTAEFLRNTLITALQEYDGAAAASAANISAQTRDMQNAYQQLIVAFETPINSSLTPVLSTITEGLIWATDNAQLLEQVFGVAVVTALARATAAGISHTAELVNNARAAAVSRVATIAAAQAELQKATIQRGAVLTAGQAVVAEARLAAAREGLAVATAHVTVATRAMNGVLALAGGPAGIAFMVAAALGTMAYQAYAAEDGLNKVAAAAAKVGNPFAEYSKDMLDRAKLRLTQQVAQAEQALEEMEQRFANPNPNLPRSLAPTVEALEAARANAAALAGQLEKVDALLAVKPDEASVPVAVNKDQQQLLDNLTKQHKLYGDVSEAAKVRYEIEYGSLKNLDPVINAKILQAAKELDAAKASTDAAKAASDAIDEQKKQLASLLAILDPVSTAADDMAAKERLLKTYFEQANVPLEKRQQLLNALQEQYSKPSEFDQLRGNLDPTFAENQNHSENLGILNTELTNTPESEVLKRNQINALIEAEQQRHAEVMKGINQSVAFDWDQMWNDSVARMAQGIGAATADALFEAKDFGEATQQVLKGVGKAAVQMLVEWMAQKAIAAALDNSLVIGNGAVAATTAAGTGTAITAAMAPAAATTSIATMGSGAMIGIAALVAAMAMLPSIIGKFHGGGTIPREGTYLLDGGETVYTRQQQQTLMNAMSSSSGGSGGKQLTIQQHNTIVVSNQSDAQTLEDVLPQLVAMTKSAVVDDLNNRGEVWHAGG
jgi:tape measure domain-containing protein